MKKILLISLFMLSACGVEKTEQVEVFEADFVEIKKSDVCENLDASVKEEMSDAAVKELCAHEVACGDFEIELDCTGEWCITHRTCRLEQNSLFETLVDS